MKFTRYQCITFAILSSIISSTSTLIKVRGVQLVPPMLAAAGGVLIGGLISFTYLLCVKKLPRLSSIRQVLKPLVMLTLCRSIVANLLFTTGLLYSSGIKAMFLTKMEPYLVIFWVWLLDGVKPSGKHLTLLFIHIFGALLLSAGRNLITEPMNVGDLIIFLAVIAAALSYRFVPYVTKSLTPMQTATITEGMGGVLTLPFALLISPLAFGKAEQIGWIYISLHSVMFYVVAISLLYTSLGGIPGWLSSALRAIGPLIAAPIGWCFFGERLETLQIIGACIVLVTSALITRSEKKETIDDKANNVMV